MYVQLQERDTQRESLCVLGSIVHIHKRVLVIIGEIF